MTGTEHQQRPPAEARFAEELYRLRDGTQHPVHRAGR
jgi:hypothetical protein